MGTVNSKEKVILNVDRHWGYFIWPIISLPFFPPWGIYKIIRYFTDECYITERRVHIETGLLSKNVSDITISKINNCYYEQSFLGRMLGYGHVCFLSGASIGLSKYTYVTNPGEIVEVVSDAIEKKEKG